MSIRMTRDARKQSVLTAAIAVAERMGFAAMRTKDIAEEAQCAHGTVALHWATLGQLRRAVMRAAVQQRNLKIIAFGLAISDKDAQRAPDELKRIALASLAG